MLFSPPLVQAAELAEQLQQLRIEAIEQQKAEVQKAEHDLMAKELQYPPGKLIARGVISLSTDGLDPRQFPLGLASAGLIDPAFEKDSASVILLAVGREGPPLAGKRLPLKELTFPLIFEVTDDDLLFPYTPEAWLTSPFSSDTIAVTAILNSEGKLSIPIGAQRIGYATSEPMVVAGTQQRSSANMLVINKIDSSLYTETELTLLAGVDKELEQKEAAKLAATKTGGSSSNKRPPAVVTK